MDVGGSNMQGKAFSLLQELVAVGKTREKSREPLCPPLWGCARAGEGRGCCGC